MHYNLAKTLFFFNQYLFTD